MVTPTPGCAGWISGGEDHIFEMFSIRREGHYSVRIIAGNPKVTVGTGRARLVYIQSS